mgnify:CR=1 FL=1
MRIMYNQDLEMKEYVNEGKKKEECADPTVGDLADDIVAAEDLAARYPGKVTLVRTGTRT